MPSDNLLGRQIGSYQITSELGSGGMGTVYLATHPTIGKKVAVKVLRRELSQEETILQRFFYEAKAANDIRHPNVVDVLDLGRTEEGLSYLLMEHLDGVTLQRAIYTQDKFSLERIGNIGLQLCSALSAAHQRGIIHRDLKADNVFLLNRGRQEDFVKLLDFGVAKLMESGREDRGLTLEGYVVGTPAYMSPEQALGHPAAQQSDIYSLGVILYQIVTGSLPFEGSNPVVVATMHVSAPLPPPRERCPGLSPALEAVILKCLEKRTADRYKTMLEVALELSLACQVELRPHFEREQQRRLGLLLAQKKDPAVSPSIFDEETQEYEAQSDVAVVQVKTMRISPWGKRRVGIGMGALCGCVLAGLLYWGASSPALAAAPAVAPHSLVEVAMTERTVERLPVVASPETRSEAPVKRVKLAKKAPPRKIHPTKIINPFDWGGKQR